MGADEGAPDEGFNVGDVERVLFVGEADGDSAVSCAACAADAVDVVLGIVGEVVVDDVGDVVYVDAASGDVGGDHDVDIACAEAFECFDALVLRDGSGEEGAVDAVEAELVEEALGVVAAVDEADHAARVVALEDVEEKGELLIFGDDIDDLFDCIYGDVFRFDDDRGRVAGPGGCEAANIVAEGCAEEERLPFIFVRGGVDDGAHVGDEAHIEHAVSFVEDEDFDAAQVEVAAAFEVNEATGRCGDDVHALRVELGLLLFVIHSAEDRDGVDARVGAELGGIFVNLDAEFARGGEDEGARVAGLTRLPVGVAQDVVEDGEEEGSGFAGAGLALAECVAAFEGFGEDSGLDRCAVGEFQVGDASHDFIGQAEIVEARFAFSGWNLE